MQQKKEKREEGEEEEEEIEVTPNPITRGLLQPGAPGDIPVCSRTSLYTGYSVNMPSWHCAICQHQQQHHGLVH